MKVKKCTARKHCFGYKDNNCDDCDFGNEFTKLHKRIDRLKKQNETLTIQRNAWYLTAERVGEDLKKAKAEVENLKVLLEMKDVSYEGLKELYDTDTTALIEAREKTEVEVAREIFKYIENIIFKYYEAVSNNSELKLLEPIRQAECFLLNEIFGDLAELKKKYTEGESNG